MLAEILATGDEIRTGGLIDSNSAHIAEVLTSNGFEVNRHQTVGDDSVMLKTVFEQISMRSDVAVVTGGLGPTQDDLTAQIASEAAKVALALDQKALKDIESFFARINRTMTPSNRKQAMLPEGAEVLYNPVGTAPGFQIKINKCTFFCIPGVPHEMKKMMAGQVLPRLKVLQGSQSVFCLSRTLCTFGLPESLAGEKIAGLEQAFPEIKTGTRAKFPEIQIKLYLNTGDKTMGDKMLADAGEWVVQRFGIHLFAKQEMTMAEATGRLLLEQKATVSAAESCTGGLIGNWLTNTPGSSDYFLLSAVTYSNEAKVKVLGVSPGTLETHGAVDEQTARQMALGAQKISGSTYAIATTGIAGPDGGTKKKPVGTVCIAVACPDEVHSKTLFYPFARRLMNKRIFATAALDYLRRFLIKGRECG
ncbi:MAG: competence/damage-inducible protein A [Desulfobacteraceae bacterium]|nr:competence/damage-inducible protein A [Desulfobacteraceae bacterium]